MGAGWLPLGRLYEGHLNALRLIVLYGSPDQTAQAAADARAGHMFAVWITEDPDSPGAAGRQRAPWPKDIRLRRGRRQPSAGHDS